MSRKSVSWSLVAVLALGAMAQAATIIWVSDNKGFGNVEPNVPVDIGWVDLLTSLGHNVIYKNQHEYIDGKQYWRTLDPNKIAELEAADLIILSRNADSGSYSTAADNEPNQWNAVKTPLISLSAHMSRVGGKWGWLNGTATTYAMEGKLKVVDPNHPIFAGVALDPNGLVDTFNTQWNVDYVKDVNSAGNGKLLATRASDGLVSIATWETGQKFFEAGTAVAGGPRMLFVAGVGSKAVPTLDGAYNLTAEGGKIFVNAVNFMLHQGQKIAWISFHATDAASTSATSAGFVDAPDKGYTDLLKAQGYNVTRVLQTATPDVNALNAYDLVIIGRSVASASFQNAAADTWNSKITAPMIITNGYLSRKARLGFMTASTLPDTTGDIKLTVVDPNHPIFAGIARDANNIMVNNYAGIRFYPDGVTKALGISIVTDPIVAGGKLLAKLAAASGSVTAGSTVIAEWLPGATVIHDGGAGTDVLAGRRLVFLTGSRENQSKTGGGQAPGQFDLTPDGAQMFLNAVAYMMAPLPK